MTRVDDSEMSISPYSIYSRRLFTRYFTMRLKSEKINSKSGQQKMKQQAQRVSDIDEGDNIKFNNQRL